jgi:hypothetical protein
MAYLRLCVYRVGEEKVEEFLVISAKTRLTG